MSRGTPGPESTLASCATAPGCSAMARGGDRPRALGSNCVTPCPGSVSYYLCAFEPAINDLSASVSSLIKWETAPCGCEDDRKCTSRTWLLAHTHRELRSDSSAQRRGC